MKYLEEIPQDIKTKRDLKRYIEPEYIIENHMKSSAQYKEFEEHIYNVVKGCYEIEECRNYPVKFRFYTSDMEQHKLPLKEFVLNIFLWSPMCEIKVSGVMDDEFIYDFSNLTAKTYSTYINTKLIETLRSYNVDARIMNRAMADVIYNMGRVPNDFALIIGTSLSLQPFLDAYEQSDRMKEIMTTHYPSGMQPAEIEAANEQLMYEAIGIFKKMPNNEVGEILTVGKGIKDKQFREFIGNIGPKPTIEGKTIPKPVNCNNLITGLQSPSEHYIDALGARKSFVMNNSKMGPAGYFGKTVLILARTVGLSREVSDCNTVHGVHITIENQAWLDKLNDRWYRMDEDDGYHLINSKRDTHLIGKTILLRSPVTCALQNSVCAKCFGRNAVLNYDIADGLGAFGCEEISKVVNQNILSVKHLLTTISNVIKFSENFYKYFEILGGDIFVKENNNFVHDDGSEDFVIFIDPNSLEHVDEMDGDFMFNTVCKGSFMVIKRATGEADEISCVTVDELYPTERCIQLIKQGGGYIDFADIGEDALFSVDIQNNELTRPLYNIMSLIKKSANTANETIDSMTQKFISYIIEANMDATAVQCEMIINRLVRSDQYKMDRPDFTKEDLEPYHMVSVSQAISVNHSALLGLSFEKIKSQMISHDTFYEKNGTAYLDPLFEPVVNVDKFMSHKRITPDMIKH